MSRHKFDMRLNTLKTSQCYKASKIIHINEYFSPMFEKGILIALLSKVNHELK